MDEIFKLLHKYKNINKEKMIMIKSILIGVSLLILSGCAAIFKGTSQEVSIRSNDNAAKIYVNDVFMGKGSTRTVFKKNKNYTIRVEQKDCTATTVSASKSFDPITLLGVLIDYGIFTVLVVDGLGTGAWQEFDQESFVIDAQCEEVL